MTSVARLNSSGSTFRKGAKTVAIASFTQTSIGPSCGFDRLGGRVDLLVIGDVGRQHERLPAERLDLSTGTLETGLAPRKQADVGAALREGVRDRPPDAAPRRR